MKHTINNEERNQSGVYQILNKINNKSYIGSTKSLILRYRSHLSSLSRGKSCCRILQSSVIKHGLENFIFNVLEICDNYEEREQYYLDKLKPAYNIMQEIPVRRVTSQETRDLMSEKLKERYRSGWQAPMKGKSHSKQTKDAISLNRNKHQVISNNLITGEVLEFCSIKAAQEHFKFGLSSIYQCCLGRRTSVHNIKFIYKTNS